ncbi:MAG: hypothetical protein K8U57_35895 [Planctomycetes bacterium]|nr:hypothetical protein [Planctomycetota bacterium]
MTQALQDTPKRPIERIITVICDFLPSIGKIKEHKFITSLGAKINFVRCEPSNMSPGYYLNFLDASSGQYWVSAELRELAEECLMLADHLDGKK